MLPEDDRVRLQRMLDAARKARHLDILWATVQDSLPSLIQALESSTLAEDEEV